MRNIIFIFILPFNMLLAEQWSQTAFLYHWGNNFNTVAGSDAVLDQQMTTYTLEHAGSWKYGSNFFFIDMTSGNFTSAKSYKVYAEWAPALSLSKVFKSKIEFAFIKDISLSGELNQGDAFQAKNVGIRFSFVVPGFNFFDLNLFCRDDNYNEKTYQVTMAWKSTFSLGSLGFIFEGFFDYYGVDYGSETVSQPRLLLDGKTYGITDLHIGLELYYYRSSEAPWRDAVEEVVPQITAKWIW